MKLKNNLDKEDIVKELEKFPYEIESIEREVDELEKEFIVGTVEAEHAARRLQTLRERKEFMKGFYNGCQEMFKYIE